MNDLLDLFYFVNLLNWMIFRSVLFGQPFLLNDLQICSISSTFSFEWSSNLFYFVKNFFWLARVLNCVFFFASSKWNMFTCLWCLLWPVVLLFVCVQCNYLSGDVFFCLGVSLTSCLKLVSMTARADSAAEHFYYVFSLDGWSSCSRRSGLWLETKTIYSTLADLASDFMNLYQSRLGRIRDQPDSHLECMYLVRQKRYVRIKNKNKILRCKSLD